MKNIIPFLFLMISLSAEAQVAWQKNYQISDPAAFTVLERAQTLVQTADGGYLVGGFYTQANEARLAYLMKINANGDSVWTKLYTYSSRLAKLYFDNNNDLRGVFEIFAPGNGTSLYFTKIDPATGDTLAGSFKAPKSNNLDVYRYTSHIQLADNSYLLAAQGNGQAGYFERFTPGATTATWYADSLANKVITFTDMVLDGPDVVLSGWNGAPGGLNVNFMVAKYDVATGMPVWRRTMLYANGTCCDSRGRCIIKNAAGNYVVGGEWREVFNSVVYITPALFVVSPNGDSLSITETHTGGTVQDIVKWGNYLLASGQIEKDDLAPDNSMAHHTDIGLIVMDDNAHLINFSQRFNNLIMIPNSFGGGYLGTYWSNGGLMVDATNNVLIYGQGAHLPMGNSSTDQNSFVAKLMPNTTDVPDFTQQKSGFRFTPNPFDNQFKIEAEEKGNVIVTNLLGQKVFEDDIDGSLTVSADNWAPGLYLIRFDNGKRVTTAKIIRR